MPENTAGPGDVSCLSRWLPRSVPPWSAAISLSATKAGWPKEGTQPALFKRKQTAGVRCLIERLWRRGDWQEVGQGFDAVETPFQ